MEIVVDTPVLIAVVTHEPTRSRLIELTVDAQLVAPASVHWEIGNACSAMVKRRRVTARDAQQILEAYQRIPIRFVEVDLARAVSLAAQYDLYAYDAYLLVCALEYHSPLLTLDRGLRHAVQRAGVTFLEVE